MVAMMMAGMLMCWWLQEQALDGVMRAGGGRRGMRWWRQTGTDNNQLKAATAITDATLTPMMMVTATAMAAAAETVVTAAEPLMQGFAPISILVPDTQIF